MIPAVNFLYIAHKSIQKCVWKRGTSDDVQHRVSGILGTKKKTFKSFFIGLV